TITSPDLAIAASIKVGPSMGSDHLPLTITLNSTPARNSGQPERWIINNKKWAEWNKSLQESLEADNFISVSDPAEAAERFTKAMNVSNLLHFKKPKPFTEKPGEQSRPWWDEECNRLVKNARQAFRRWRKSPLSTNLRAEWSRAEAIKKKYIISTKKKTWETFLSNLGPEDQPRLWSFVKCMTGKGTNISADGTSINTSGGVINSPKEKTEAFLLQFGDAYPANIPTNTVFEEFINASISSPTP
ncbi:Uncharacterized protein APZ42_007874, partial [Daphnia magna]